MGHDAGRECSRSCSQFEVLEAKHRTTRLQNCYSFSKGASCRLIGLYRLNYKYLNCDLEIRIIIKCYVMCAGLLARIYRGCLVTSFGPNRSP